MEPASQAGGTRVGPPERRPRSVEHPRLPRPTEDQPELRTGATAAPAPAASSRASPRRCRTLRLADTVVATLEDTSLEAWAARPEPAVPAAAEASSDRSTPATSEDAAPLPEPPSPERPGRARAAAPHPPLDDLGAPRAGGDRIQGSGSAPSRRARAHACLGRRPRRNHPARGNADRHRAGRAAAGAASTLPARRAGPRTTSRSILPSRPSTTSRRRSAQHHRSTSVRPRPSRCCPSMETAAPDEVPIPPPPPPLDVAPVPEEGAVRIEPGSPSESRPRPPAAPLAPVVPVETRTGGRPGPRSPGPRRDRAGRRAPAAGAAELGIEINPESIRVCWFHDGRAETAPARPGPGPPGGTGPPGPRARRAAADARPGRAGPGALGRRTAALPRHCAPTPTPRAPSPGAGRRRWCPTTGARPPSRSRAERSARPSSWPRCSAGFATAPRS